MVTITKRGRNADWVDDSAGAAARIPYAGKIRGSDWIITARIRLERGAQRVMRDMENAPRRNPTRQRELERALDRWDNEGGAGPPGRVVPAVRSSKVPRMGVPRYVNDIGVRDIRIGVTQFHCMGALPPHDHPHIYLNMEGKPDMLCPYCATSYRYDSRLRPDETEPAGCFYAPMIEGVASSAEGRGS